MIFMRTVGTSKARLRQVRTYCTDLAVSLCMAVNGIRDPQIRSNIKLKAANEIHSFIMTSGHT